MPRPNKSRWAVLGFLSWQPASGYDIRRAIAESVGNFWSESYGQIYPALRELEREGLAVRNIERTPGKPDRHVYTITDAGRRELGSWLEAPADPHVYRVEVLIKLFFGRQVPVAASLAHIARYRAEHERLVARYAAIGDHLADVHAGDPSLPYWRLTVECGLKIGRAYVEWCDQAERALRGLEMPPTNRPDAAPRRAARGTNRRGGGPKEPRKTKGGRR